MKWCEFQEDPVIDRQLYVGRFDTGIIVEMSRFINTFYLMYIQAT